MGKEKDEFGTDLYCKAADCHQYLHSDSFHPDHMKRSSVYSQGLQMKRLCSDGQKLQKHLENLRNWFRERGYPGSLMMTSCRGLKGKAERNF